MLAFGDVLIPCALPSDGVGGCVASDGGVVGVNSKGDDIVACESKVLLQWVSMLMRWVNVDAMGRIGGALFFQLQRVTVD